MSLRMSNPTGHVEIVADWLSRLISSDQVFEIRALGKRSNGSKLTLSGYFDASHLREAAAAAIAQTANPLISAVYWTINPLNPALLARCPYKLEAIGKDEGPKDSDVIRRQWLLIDCDPKRPSGISSTDSERAKSFSTAESIYGLLTTRGWPSPAVADSGNGTHLLYRIDLPSEDESLVKTCLKALAAKFTTDEVDVDTSVFNPSRICKLYGTISRKGGEVEDRKHRRSSLKRAPSNTIVDLDLLIDLASEAPVSVNASSNGHAKPIDHRPGDRSIVDRCRKALASPRTKSSNQGQHGSDDVYHAACVIAKDFDLPHQWGFPLLIEYNETKGNPPWSEPELQKKWKDADESAGPRGLALVDNRPHTTTVGSTTTFGPFDDEHAVESEADPLAGLSFDDPSEDITPDITSSQQLAAPAEQINPAAALIGPICNFKEDIVDTSKGPVMRKLPLPISAIAGDVQLRTDNWPRRVGDMMFVPNLNTDGIAWLKTADSLFGYIGERIHCPPEFTTGEGYHTKGELFAYLPRVSQDYEAVEMLPHEPLIDRHYYACTFPAIGNGEAISALVDRFSPETEIDRDLILAAFVTPFWGGRGGTRPAFCLTSDAGRGCGKSTLASCIANLAGGAVELSNGEDITLVKSRLLSPDGVTKRIALLDNVKSLKFSWAELEALITSPSISGKRLYVGEASRPNHLTFVITLNGVSLSTDLAQRCVIVKLRKPDFSGTWTEETMAFITAHRTALVADALAFLRQPASELIRFSRWGDWEKHVLARLPEPSEAQTIIRERQAVADVEREESDLIEEHFAKRLEEIGLSPITERIFIPAGIAAEWLGKATNDRLTVLKASRMIRQKIDEGSFHRILECHGRANGRGFEWWGTEATGELVLRTDIEHQIEIHTKRHRGFGNGTKFE